MNRVFLIGAGFSKALANAPQASNLIKSIYEYSNDKEKLYGHSEDWSSHRNYFHKLLHYLHETTQPLIKRLENDDTKEIINKDFDKFLYGVNIEFLCSLLDLHIKHPFIPEAEGVDLQGCPIPFLREFYSLELEGALKFIMHTTLELLLEENLKIEEATFRKMASFFEPGDGIISFNYDLLTEQLLWQQNLWNPFDGYGFEFKTGGNEEFPETQIRVIKIHGSINWRAPDSFFHPNLELSIEHPFFEKALFDGLKITESHFAKKKYRPYPLYSHVILPTFIKAPEYNWEIQLIENARNLCREAKEVFILGYSCPNADYIANLLFADMNKESKITIVLWEKNKEVAKELAEKLTTKFNFKRENIVNEDTRIEEWVNNNFGYESYKKYLEDKKLMEAIIKAPNNP